MREAVKTIFDYFRPNHAKLNELNPDQEDAIVDILEDVLNSKEFGDNVIKRISPGIEKLLLSRTLHASILLPPIMLAANNLMGNIWPEAVNSIFPMSCAVFINYIIFYLLGKVFPKVMEPR